MIGNQSGICSFQNKDADIKRPRILLQLNKCIFNILVDTVVWSVKHNYLQIFIDIFHYDFCFIQGFKNKILKGAQFFKGCMTS